MFENGTFVFVKEANAATDTKAVDTTDNKNSLAQKISSDIALNFNDEKAHGDANAPITLYEFSSLGCGHCADFHLNILPLLEQDFISQGKLRVVFVNFPLEKKSMKAAMLSECLDSQKREEFLKTAFLKQREWMLSFKSEDILSKYAVNENFDFEAAKKCVTDDKLAERILADRQDAIDKLKMQGTPAFLFTSGDVREIIYGVPEYEELKPYIESLLH